MSFDDFRNTYSPVAMRTAPRHADELIWIAYEHGRLRYHQAPVSSEEVSMAPGLPTSLESAPTARYLWVVDESDVPHALEKCRFASSLASGVIKHSNLTGGGEAYLGGELWFIDDRSIIINFCSGRYGISVEDSIDVDVCEAKIEAVVQALMADGYRVATTGKNEEEGWLSARILLSTAPVWRSAQDDA